MAKLEGIPRDMKVGGRIEEWLIYPLEDDHIIRMSSAVSKERYKKDAAFAGLRRYQDEFGLASKLGKTLRRSMQKYIRGWSQPKTCSDLNAVMLGCIRKGRGAVGKRSFELRNFALREDQFLDKDSVILRCEKAFQFDRSRAEVYLRMSYGKLKKLFGRHELPIKIVLGVLALSEVEFRSGYHVIHPQWHGQSAFNEKKQIRQWPAKGELRLKARLKMNEPIPDRVGLIGVLGIQKL